ncbi:fluoride efflux transporter CrcB [Fictibacillus sp. UD]|uniref:fluoride efflux transporter CrcB n=1 Tax=Fictibacillus sp. UD TaxID=3038777 RepID=UPI00374633D3
MNYLFIGFGGIVGAQLRYYVGLMVVHKSLAGFPIATLAANLLGCFALGWFTTRVANHKIMRPEIISGLGTGLIGSFTTFSTFSADTMLLIQDNRLGTAFLYVFISLFGGLLLSWAGHRLGEVRHNSRMKGDVS